MNFCSVIVLWTFLFLSITIIPNIHGCKGRGEQCERNHGVGNCCGGIECVSGVVDGLIPYCVCIKDGNECRRASQCCNPESVCHPTNRCHRKPTKPPCGKTGQMCDEDTHTCCGSTKCIGQQGQTRFCGCIPHGRECKDTFDCCDFGTKGIICKAGKCVKK